jgi:hypothetical protein
VKGKINNIALALNWSVFGTYTHTYIAGLSWRYIFRRLKKRCVWEWERSKLDIGDYMWTRISSKNNKRNVRIYNLQKRQSRKFVKTNLTGTLSSVLWVY